MNTVTSAKNPLAYLKAIVTLIGSTATALLTIYVGNEVLTVIAIVATVFGTWYVSNAEVVPESPHFEDPMADPSRDTSRNALGDLAPEGASLHTRPRGLGDGCVGEHSPATNPRCDLGPMSSPSEDYDRG